MKSKLENIDGSRDLGDLASPDGWVLSGEWGEGRRSTLHLDGNVARRATGTSDHVLWDDQLPGFGLRVRPSGHKSWIVHFRRRGKQKRVTLGAVGTLDARSARAQAHAILRDIATDGLPGRTRSIEVPTFADYAPRFWREYAGHWKLSTARGNGSILKTHLIPTFGALAVDEIAKADVLRWRDDMAGKPCTFKNALPLLGVMLTYAEQLGFRRKGSNPCRGVPRFKRGLKERYLSPKEFARLGAVLAAAEADMPLDVAMVCLLIYTGARTSEITSLKWDYVEGERLRLPDSKTGPKYVYLNSQARAVLDALPRGRRDDYIFPAHRSAGPYRQLGLRWAELRSRAAIPDVCLHDLRHSFASVAININVPLASIGRLLGHELPETTARYAHLMDESIAEAANRVCHGIARQLGMAS